jgi:hypothetical protein
LHAVVDAAAQSAIIVNKEAVSEADNQASRSVPSPVVDVVADSTPVESEPQLMDDLAADDVNESDHQNLKEAANNTMDAVQFEENGLAVEEPELDAPAQDKSKVEVTHKPESDELSGTIASQVEAHSAGHNSSTIGDDASQESQHEISHSSLPPSISSVMDFAMIDMSGASNVTSEASLIDNHAIMGAPTTMPEDVLIADQVEAPTDLEIMQVPPEDSMTVEETEDDAPVNMDQAGAEHMDILQPVAADNMDVEDPEGDDPVDMDQAEAEHGMNQEEAAPDAVDMDFMEAAPEDAMDGTEDADAPEDMDIPEATAGDSMSATDSDAPFEVESVEAAIAIATTEAEVNEAPLFIPDWKTTAEKAKQETLEFLKQAGKKANRPAAEPTAAPSADHLHMALQNNSLATVKGI